MISSEFFEAVKKLKKEVLDKRNKILVNKLYKKISKTKKLPKEFVEKLLKTTKI